MAWCRKCNAELGWLAGDLCKACNREMFDEQRHRYEVERAANAQEQASRAIKNKIEEERSERERESQFAAIQSILNAAKKIEKLVAATPTDAGARLDLLARLANRFSYPWESWLAAATLVPHQVEVAYSRLRQSIIPLINSAVADRGSFLTSPDAMLRTLATTFLFRDFDAMRGVESDLPAHLEPFLRRIRRVASKEKVVEKLRQEAARAKTSLEMAQGDPLMRSVLDLLAPHPTSAGDRTVSATEEQGPRCYCMYPDTSRAGRCSECMGTGKEREKRKYLFGAVEVACLDCAGSGVCSYCVGKPRQFVSSPACEDCARRTAGCCFYCDGEGTRPCRYGGFIFIFTGRASGSMECDRCTGTGVCKSCDAKLPIPKRAREQKRTETADNSGPARPTDAEHPSPGSPDPRRVYGSQWFVERGDKARGPFTVELLKQLVDEGKLKPTDKVREGDGEWVKASELGWLFPKNATPEAKPMPPKLPVARPAAPLPEEDRNDEDAEADEKLAPRKRRPAPSPDSPVEKVKAFYHKNPQKALILGGSILASVMLMGMCVCAGVFSLVNGGAGKPGSTSTGGSGGDYDKQYRELTEKVTAENVRKIHRGMSEDKVEAILGKSFHKTNDLGSIGYTKTYYGKGQSQAIIVYTGGVVDKIDWIPPH